MSDRRLVWSILNKPFFAAVFMSGLLMLRFVFGLGVDAAAVVGGLLAFAFVLLLARYNRNAGNARRREAMVQKLAEPVWVYVVREVLTVLVIAVGVVFLTREEPSVNLWTLASVTAKVFVLGAPLIIAIYVGLAYWERQGAADWLAREDNAGTR